MKVYYKNAAILLITGINSDRIVLVRDKKTKKWMLPGGKIDKTDSSPFFAAKREFKEETSFVLPNLGRRVEKYNYNNHTIIYKGYSQYKFGKFQKTNETDKIIYSKINDIFNGNFEIKYGPIKYYVKKSLIKMSADNFF